MFKLYGDDARTPGTYAANCLLARRLIERVTGRWSTSIKAVVSA